MVRLVGITTGWINVYSCRNPDSRSPEASGKSPDATMDFNGSDFLNIPLAKIALARNFGFNFRSSHLPISSAPRFAWLCAARAIYLVRDRVNSAFYPQNEARTESLVDSRKSAWQAPTRTGSNDIAGSVATELNKSLAVS